MITEFFIDGAFAFAEGILERLPPIEWSLDTSSWQYLRDFLDMIAYLLPMQHIAAIGAFIITIAIFRVVISFIRVIKGLIPFV